MLKKALFYLAFLLLFRPLSAQEHAGWKELGENGAVVSRITVVTGDVFDLSLKEENNLLGRTANALHITTKEFVVRRFLLFGEGDAVDPRLIYESERLLREQNWVREALITPLIEADGSVTAVVTVRDAWSLKGGIKFGSVGGENTFRIRAHEVNFLGLGKTLLAGYETNPERSIAEVEYFDPMLLGSRWQLFAAYQTLSDGHYKKLKLERPFFELKTPWAAGAEGSREKLNFKVYDEGSLAWEVPSITDEVSVYFHRSFSAGERSAVRAGVEAWSRQNLFDEPFAVRPWLMELPSAEDRRFRGFVIHLGYLSDRYETFTNVQAMSKAEDFNIGTEAELHAGWFSKKFGSTAAAFYSDFEVSKGFLPSENGLLLAEVSGEGRHENGLDRNLQLNAKFDYYNTRFEKHTLAASLEAFLGTRLDLEDHVYIGGSDGLRGYPNHFKIGDRRWTLSAEDRIVTDKNLWGVVQLGYVAYVDAGAIRRIDGSGWTRTYANVGAGLRLGNLKSAFGHIILITVAAPLVKEEDVDSWQFVFGNYIRF